ncbi:MAG: type II toxin-antitoxin system YafQ family toxin [Raoultibacter sp.]
MLKPDPTPHFKRDIKRLAGKHYDMDCLKKVLDLIEAEDWDTLQRRYRSHYLKGCWQGHMECHISADWLLRYSLDDEYFYLERTGSHDDIF